MKYFSEHKPHDPYNSPGKKLAWLCHSFLFSDLMSGKREKLSSMYVGKSEEKAGIFYYNER